MNTPNNYDFSADKLAEAERLFAENERLVYFCVKRYCGETNLGDEDLIQECKLALWKACLTYNTEITKFSTYAVNCIHYQINHIVMRKGRNKRKGSQNTVSLNAEIVPKGSGNPQGGIPLSEIIADHCHETINLFDKYEDIFTPRQMKIFNLRLEGLSMAKIGEKLGVSTSAVQYELVKMKKIWEENHIDFGGETY